MLSTKEARVRRARGAVALARARLRAVRGARAARASAWMIAIGFGVAAVVLRVSDGADAALGGLVISAARSIAWLAGAPLALAAAEDHRAADRRDGVLALAAARGVSPEGLASARVVATMAEIANVLGLPVLLLALLTAALSGRAGAAIDRVALGLGAVAFAIVAGVTLGGLGAASARIGRERGRWVLFALVFAPWALADLAGHGAWSIPGALGAVLDFALRVRA